MLAVILCLEVLVARGAYSDDHPDRVAPDTYPEVPFSGFDTVDRFSLSEFPPSAVGVSAANVNDPFVRVVAVAFIDALDLMILGHQKPLSVMVGGAV